VCDYVPYTILTYHTIKHTVEYVQTGSSSLLKQMSGWTNLTGRGFCNDQLVLRSLDRHRWVVKTEDVWMWSIAVVSLY
jgi:hypothetical protein